ncbi:hypothetical protein Hypma_010095 [Hypsizygus marmoreus]|uniref:DUF6534 domain-containing protein n=1 Tax=Hypsizygus marmoreus TaxID=39966 RepID=A0A369JTB6_HYPMA|nr:hypothetical protein Hypma_010095 [Hypsizygus marmoreus]
MDNKLTGEPVVEIPGAILLSGFLQSFFLGILVTQGLKYWYDYRDDSRQKRVFVASVILLAILQTALEDYKAWRTTILQKCWSTSNIQWSDLFLNGLLSSLCEGFFVRRCWKMRNKSPWVLFPLSILLATLIAANLYLAIAMAVAFHSLGSGATNDTLNASRNILTSTVVAFSYWIFGSLTLDVSLASLLVLSLWRSKTGLIELDQIVMRIIFITLESASLPSTCMLIAAGLYHASPHLKDHLVLFFVLLTGKLYAIGMLRTLNSRVKLRERMKSHDLGRTSLGDWQWAHATSAERMPGCHDSIPEPPKSFNVSEPIRSSFGSTSYLVPSNMIAPHDTSRRRSSAGSIHDGERSDVGYTSSTEMEKPVSCGPECLP